MKSKAEVTYFLEPFPVNPRRILFPVLYLGVQIFQAVNHFEEATGQQRLNVLSLSVTVCSFDSEGRAKAGSFLSLIAVLRGTSWFWNIQLSVWSLLHETPYMPWHEERTLGVSTGFLADTVSRIHYFQHMLPKFWPVEKVEIFVFK